MGIWQRVYFHRDLWYPVHMDLMWSDALSLEQLTPLDLKRIKGTYEKPAPSSFDELLAFAKRHLVSRAKWRRAPQILTIN